MKIYQKIMKLQKISRKLKRKTKYELMAYTILCMPFFISTLIIVIIKMGTAFAVPEIIIL